VSAAREKSGRAKPNSPLGAYERENMTNQNLAFTEHRIARGDGNIYAREYEGSEPAFVMMHGFPDNLRIYDDLIPYLVAAGRRVIVFDFLGFGASDKPVGAKYSFDQQLADLEAIVEKLGRRQVTLVPHDSSGLAAINFAIKHPNKVASLRIFNSAYDNSAIVRWPDMINLFAIPGLDALASAFVKNPEQFVWLLNWQKDQLAAPLSVRQKDHFLEFIGPLIADNFILQPSSGDAFIQLTAQFFEELARNSGRLHLVKGLDLPVKVIWGENDQYLNVAMGKERAAQFRNSSFHPVPTGHWLQSDEPEMVAKLMLQD
jgi:haloalkane dehalogenase